MANGQSFNLMGGFNYFFWFSPQSLGKIPHFDEHIFQMGLVQPPTSTTLKALGLFQLPDAHGSTPRPEKPSHRWKVAHRNSASQSSLMQVLASEQSMVVKKTWWLLQTRISKPSAFLCLKRFFDVWFLTMFPRKWFLINVGLLIVTS